MKKYEEVWEVMGFQGNIWKVMGKYAMKRKRIGKVWEGMEMYENVL